MLVLHAEANAITKVAKSSNSSEGATLYVTASPCIECAKLIIQAGIRRVVYSEQYRYADGIELLKKANVEVELVYHFIECSFPAFPDIDFIQGFPAFFEVVLDGFQCQFPYSQAIVNRCDCFHFFIGVEVFFINPGLQ